MEFENINENEALNQMKFDFEIFLAALVKMKMVDNFDHTLPKGLSSFAKFYFSHHEMIYQNQEDPRKIYGEFLEWLKYG
ncbi:MAG: hypothetical protein ACFE9T_13465 [Promethearchaeota archaeon]